MKSVLAQLLLTALGLFVQASLASAAEPAFIGEKCKPAGDQIATFNQPIRKLPVAVILDKAFSSSQRGKIVEAIQEWNRVGQEKLGTPIFNILAKIQASFQSFAIGNRYCALPAAKRPDGLLVLRVDSADDWHDAGVQKNAGGVQYRCELGNTPDGKISLLMMINTSLTDYDQLRAVALHELGHAIGLRHSCNPAADLRLYRGCSAIRKDHSYREAVMDPTLDGTDWRDVDSKSTLQANDIDRVHCLYQKYPFK